MPRWVRKIFLKVFDRYTLLKKNGFSFNLPATFNLLINVNLIYRCILSLKIFHSSIVLGHYSLGYFITEYFTKFLVDPWFLSVFTELLRITDLNLLDLAIDIKFFCRFHTELCLCFLHTCSRMKWSYPLQRQFVNVISWSYSSVTKSHCCWLVRRGLENQPLPTTIFCVCLQKSKSIDWIS